MSIRHALALLCLGIAGAAAHGATLSLDDTLAAARANLDVTIATRGLAAARADILAADHAPLPVLTGKASQMDFQHGLGPGNLLRDKRIDKSIGIDWTWERGNKRALRTDAARQGAAAAESDVDEVRTQQALAVQAAYFELLAVQLRIDELREIQAATVRSSQAAQARVKAGDAAVQDAARAGIEAERALADAEAARLDLQRAQLDLARLVGRESEAATLAAAGPWPAAANAAPGTVNAAPAALEALVDRRSDVRAAASRVQQAQAALDGARALRRQDVTWGASFDHYPGTSTRQVELRFSVPLAFGYRFEGEAGRAQAQLDQARDTLEKTRRDAIAELQRLQAELAAAAARWQRFDGEIVPRSREVAARAELAFNKGATPLTDLLDARRTLRAVLLDALDARADLAKADTAWRLRTATGTATTSTP